MQSMLRRGGFDGLNDCSYDRIMVDSQTRPKGLQEVLGLLCRLDASSGCGQANCKSIVDLYEDNCSDAPASVHKGQQCTTRIQGLGYHNSPLDSCRYMR